MLVDGDLAEADDGDLALGHAGAFVGRLASPGTIHSSDRDSSAGDYLSR
jgi:hypothetical protein